MRWKKSCIFMLICFVLVTSIVRNYLSVTPADIGAIADVSAVIVGSETTVSHVFSIVNPSGEAILINDHSTSCSCTNIEMSAMEIMPHDAVKMKVDARVTRPAQPSEQLVSIDLQTSLEDVRAAKFYIRIQKYPQISLRTPLVHAGTFKQSESFSVPLVIDSYSKEMAAVDFDAPYLDKRSLQQFHMVLVGKPVHEMLATGVKKTTWKVILKTNSGTVFGEQSKTLLVGVKGAEQDPVQFTLGWQTEMPVSAVPKRIFLGDLDKLSDNNSYGFQLNSIDGSLFEVHAISSNHSAVRCRQVDLPFGSEKSGYRSCSFVVHVDPSKVASPHISAIISVEIRQGKKFVVPITLLGFRVRTR